MAIVSFVSLIVGILSLAGTCFALGYAIGKDIHHHDDNKQK